MIIPLWPKNENTVACRSATSVDVNDLSIGAQSRRSNTHAKISVFGGKNDGRTDGRATWIIGTRVRTEIRIDEGRTKEALVRSSDSDKITLGVRIAFVSDQMVRVPRLPHLETLSRQRPQLSN